MTDLLVIFHDIPQMIPAAIVRSPHTYGVVGEVYIAVITEEFRHCVVAWAGSFSGRFKGNKKKTT